VYRNGLAMRTVPDRLARDFWVRPDEKMARLWCRAYVDEIDFDADYQAGVVANFSGILCGGHDAAEPLLLESLEIGLQSGDMTPVFGPMWILGRLYGLRGQFQAARQELVEALEYARQVDYKVVLPSVLVTLGDLPPPSRSGRRRATGIACPSRRRAHGRRWCGRSRLAALSLSWRLSVGDHRAAVCVLSALSSVPDRPGTTAGVERVSEQDVIATARHTLGEDEFAHGRTVSRARSSR
jgi:hypothetical protein